MRGVNHSKKKRSEKEVERGKGRDELGY